MNFLLRISVFFLLFCNEVWAENPFQEGIEKANQATDFLKSGVAGALFGLIAAVCLIAGMAGYGRKETLLRVAGYAVAIGCLAEIVAFFF